ncbi:uncharacterized protein LOC144928809 [Branchiostoma floridae x Branchiostoma belcheri]
MGRGEKGKLRCPGPASWPHSFVRHAGGHIVAAVQGSFAERGGGGDWTGNGWASGRPAGPAGGRGAGGSARSGRSGRHYPSRRGPEKPTKDRLKLLKALHDDKRNSYSRIQLRSGIKYQVNFAMSTLRCRLQLTQSWKDWGVHSCFAAKKIEKQAWNATAS